MQHRVADEVAQIAFPISAVVFGQIDKGPADDYFALLVDDFLPGLQCRNNDFVCSSNNNNNNTSQTS